MLNLRCTRNNRIWTGERQHPIITIEKMKIFALLISMLASVCALANADFNSKEKYHFAPPSETSSANIAPTYPKQSRDLGEQGRVILRVFVTPDGAASRVTVKHTSGFGHLDKAALKAVRKWKFVPASNQGKPIGEWCEVPILFRLNEPPSPLERKPTY